MSNKAHLRPHPRKRRRNGKVTVFVALLFIALFVLAVAMAATGHYVPAGRLPL
jgi:hypothetical protein